MDVLLFYIVVEGFFLPFYNCRDRCPRLSPQLEHVRLITCFWLVLKPPWLKREGDSSISEKPGVLSLIRSTKKRNSGKIPGFRFFNK